MNAVHRQILRGTRAPWLIIVALAATACGGGASSSGGAGTGGGSSGGPPPALTVTLSTTTLSPTNVTAIPVSVSFSAAVTGFAATKLLLGNATVTNFTGSGTSYSFQLVPSTTGSVTVTVPDGVVTDAAGASNSASSVLSLMFNDTPPTVSVASTAANPTNQAPIPVTVSFSEAVTGFSTAGLTVTNAMVSGFSGSGAMYGFQLTPTAAGTVSVVVNAAAAKDAAGNSNLASTLLSRSYQPVATVTPSASSGASMTIAPSSVQTVNVGATMSFSVTANGAEILSQSVGGSCPAGTWSTYAYATGSYVTGAITANCTVVFGVTGGTVRYSKPPGNIDSGSGTLADPYQSIWQNIGAAQAGDVIFLLPGTYTECVFMEKSGTATRPITMTGAGTAPAKGAATTGGATINCTETKTGAIYMVPAYVTISNLTIGPSPNSGSGLFINSNATGICHNVIVDHVTIHDTSGAGYQSILCGALTLTNSIFYNNGLTYANACASGISLGGNIDDGTRAYDNVVNGNVAYGNGNPPHCNPAGTGFNSDGEGLIVDYGPDATPCASYTYFSSLPPGYYCASTSRTLISNNVFYGNQSAGIQVFNGNNADIINNTLYHNETATDHASAEYGEIKVGGLAIGPIAKSMTIENNILVPYRASNSGIACQYLTDVLVANNLNGNSGSPLFSARSACSSYTVEGNVTATAGATLFVAGATPNFQLAAGSPAIGLGLNLQTLIGSSSLYGVLGLDYAGEPRGAGAWDAGACQYSASPPGACP